jgi:anti-sigma regulatory factor (Ser/Thr protein kinase)
MLPGATGLRAAVDLPPVATSVAAARRVVAQVLDAWAVGAQDGRVAQRDDAVLLVSELVTNVVRHVAGRAALRLEIRLAAPLLHVAVVDSSTVPPAVRPGTSAGGHGLGLVAAVADRWGSEEQDGGKRIWFELQAG